ncbi:MAG TPA: ATP-binding protein [Dehalococcoidia bacterium]|nr:ATP-binding protein [Dehalococcoidia bacterium]
MNARATFGSLAAWRTRRLAEVRPSLPPAARYLRNARVRLTVWYVGILFVLLVAAGLGSYLVLARVRAEEVDSDLRSVALDLANRAATLPAAQASGDGPTYAGLLGFDGSASSVNTGPHSDVFYVVWPVGGVPDVYTPPNLKLKGFPDSASVNAAVASGHADLRTVHKDGQAYRVLSQIVRRNGQPPDIEQVGKSLGPYQNELRDTALVLAGVGIGALALAAMGGMLVAGRALRPAQLSWQRQQEFVADASHELRTPLSLIRADAEVLLRAPTRPVAENRDLVEDIVHEADHLSALVADLLVLARLDAGQLPLHKSEIDAGELLKELGSQTVRLLAGRDIGLLLRRPRRLVVHADRDRIVQVLRILIDNAQRHTPAGGSITLRARRTGGRVQLSVADTGSGIPPEHRERVFERFYRVDAARGRTDGGAGLGLAIARGLVEAHEGRLWLQSERGRGTTVFVELPG